MANCALTQDYSFGCDTGSGGTLEAYIIELNNILSYTESSGTITAITKATGKIFRKYQLIIDTATFDETLQGNIQNGTLYYDQKGVIIINKQNVSMRNEILLLAQMPLVIVIKDNNNTQRLYGRLHGLRLQGGSATTGTAFSDRNGYTLEFSGHENELAPFVSDAAYATLQTPGE